MNTADQPKFIRMLLVALIHIGVGISIVIISSFVNAEMKFATWPTSQISFYLGIPVLFELSRLVFAYLYDQKGWLRISLIFGIITSITGILLIPSVITPVGNFVIIIAISLFYLGSSILTTLVDSNLTLVSSDDGRSQVAGVIQVLRLSGFAIGGIVGSLLYSELDFALFIQLVAIFYLLTGIVSVFAVYPVSSKKDRDRSFGESIITLSKLIVRGMPGLMTIFLILYPIGLFMQDLVLEPFAIDILNFQRDSVGRVVAIWTSLTLVFVPVGVIMEKQFTRMFPIIGGAVLSFSGLIGLSVVSVQPNLIVFYGSLVIFGIGNGIASAPAIGMMLDVCAAHPHYLALLLGFFGIMNTVGRFIAAITGGIVLSLSNDNYTILFVTEAFFVVLSFLPLVPLNRKLQAVEVDDTSLDPITVSSIDLN